jgi:glucokinase
LAGPINLRETMASHSSYYAGLDIGGTTVKAVLVNHLSEQAGPLTEVRSHVKDGYEATFTQLEIALDQLASGAGIARSEIQGIGLDVPAPSSDGVIWGPANLGEDWVGTDIRGKLSARTGLPVFMTNDGNAAALGEYALRHKHLGSLMLVAPGTGLGGGLVLPGGRSYEGTNGMALEVGHVSVPFREDDGELPACSCGLKGCTEAWVSLVALRRRLGLELAKPQWASHPLNAGEATIEEKAFRLREFAEKGDSLAVQIFKQQGFILGYAIADMVRVFDPGLVVIGGGLAETSFRDSYMSWIQDGFADRAWPVYRHSPIHPEQVTTHFEWAIGGDAAAAIGMAYTAREWFQ